MAARSAKATSRRRPAIRWTGRTPSSTTRPRSTRRWSASSTSATAAAAASACAAPFRPCSTSSITRRSMEVDGVAKADYGKVVDHCYLCDLCYMTKCPYVPPHEWNLDFPHLMLRAKAVITRRARRCATGCSPAPTRSARARRHPGGGAGRQRRQLASRPAAQGAEGAGGDRRRRLAARICPRPLRRRLEIFDRCDAAASPRDARRQGRAVRHLLREPQRARPRRGSRRGVRAQRHSGHDGGPKEKCCGMPKLELGDLEAVRARSRKSTFRALARLVDEGWDLDRARALLRADVQAGAAADVSRRRRRAEGEGAHSTIRSNT